MKLVSNFRRMKIVWTGIESSGKDLHLSIQADKILRRNKAWLRKRKKLGLETIPRTMAFMAPMSKEFRAQVENAGLKYLEFKNLIEVLGLSECDIFIGELIKLFPSNGSNSLSREQLDFITQGAKDGVHIFAASQDFSQVHKQFRLLVNEVYVVTKLFGSKRPIKSAPPVKRIWGLCMVRRVSPASFKGDNATMESSDMFPSFTWIRREDTQRFDTSYKVPLTTLPVRFVRKQEIQGKDEFGNVVYKKSIWV